MRTKFGLKILAVITALVLIASSVVVYSATDVEKGIDEGGGKGVITLVAPPFVEIASASPAGGGGAPRAGTIFLKEEAGISTYTNVEETIDLEKAKTAFRTIENETGEYIIGSVPLPDSLETEDVHAYVHKDGWVVTYYLKEEPAAKILDWEDYGTDEEIKGTKLEDGIIMVCNAAGVPMRNITYYDFEYPNADKLMIVADALWGRGSGIGTDSFRIKLPSDFVFYERSYSHYHKGPEYSKLSIDGKQISYLRESQYDIARIDYGLLSPTQLSPDEFHTIEFEVWWNYNTKTFDAIVLIYREA